MFFLYFIACNETVLESKYTDLYGKDIYPGCPDDLQLKPIMEIHPSWPKHGYRPGFVVTIKPPRTGKYIACSNSKTNSHW